MSFIQLPLVPLIGKRYLKKSPVQEWRKPIAGPQSVPCVVVIDGGQNSENSGLVR